MKPQVLATIVVISASVVGCGRKPAEKVERGPGIEVNAPGVHIEAGNGKGVEVEAPGVEIHSRPVK